MAKMTLDELVSQLRAAFGADLRAVALYGSAAAGEHHPKKSDYNVLVIVDSLPAARLQAASAAISAWTDAGNPAPLTLTTEEWRGSADIFAMEYSDILERHKELHGTLPKDIRVKPADLRLQLEHEAMGTLLQLRRGALSAGNDGKKQLELLDSSSSTVMVIFRALLRLRHETPPHNNVELCQRVAAIAGIESTALVQVILHRRGEQAIKPADAARVLDGYLSGMQAVVHYLDRYTEGR